VVQFEPKPEARGTRADLAFAALALAVAVALALAVLKQPNDAARVAAPTAARRATPLTA
jgi:hypothetical protein